jgi:hypothetical protein
MVFDFYTILFFCHIIFQYWWFSIYHVINDPLSACQYIINFHKNNRLWSAKQTAEIKSKTTHTKPRNRITFLLDSLLLQSPWFVLSLFLYLAIPKIKATTQVTRERNTKTTNSDSPNEVNRRRRRWPESSSRS